MKINFTRIKNDVNGNPRYVCHFLNFIAKNDKGVADKYALAVKRANTIGGKKFHNKQYGGGIVFQCYNIYDLEERILKMVKELDQK